MLAVNFTVLIKDTPFVLLDRPDQLAHGDQFQVLPETEHINKSLEAKELWDKQLLTTG